MISEPFYWLALAAVLAVVAVTLFEGRRFRRRQVRLRRRQALITSHSPYADLVVPQGNPRLPR